MRTIAIVQKPLDVLNALECCHALGVDHRELEWLVVGRSKRQRSTMAFLSEQGRCARYLLEPDLLAQDQVVSLLDGAGPMRKVLLGSLYPLAFLHWHAALLVHLYQLRDCGQAELVILDAWRTKLLPLLALPKGRQCFVDGGFSTETFGLLQAFREGGAPGLVKTSLGFQRVLSVPWLRRAIVDRIDREGKFFSAYWGQAPEPNGVRNQYDYFGGLLLKRRDKRGALILGYPGFLHAEESCKFAVEWLGKHETGDGTAELVYRPHPRDVAGRSSEELDGLQRRLAQAVSRDVRVDTGRLGLELDLLADESLPSQIFSYRSAARAVLVGRKGVRWIDLPEFGSQGWGGGVRHEGVSA